jgi:hypothetical protein
LEAGDKVQETVASTPDADAVAFAAAGDVSAAAFRNYGTALDAYAARADIESLADRRARENGTTFAEADHMRAEVSDTPPTPGSTNGVAPASV